jgi:hypothetical protein
VGGHEEFLAGRLTLVDMIASSLDRMDIGIRVTIRLFREPQFSLLSQDPYLRLAGLFKKTQTGKTGFSRFKK